MMNAELKSRLPFIPRSAFRVHHFLLAEDISHLVNQSLVFKVFGFDFGELF